MPFLITLIQVLIYPRDSDVSEDFIKVFTKLCSSERDNHDIEFICDDGSISYYQVNLIFHFNFHSCNLFIFQSILAGHSEFIKNLLCRFHSVEFSIGDWQYGEMFLLDRRKTNERVRISLPDVETRHVSLMLDLFTDGYVTLASPQEAKILKDLWRLFKIDTVRLDALEVISEVNLLKANSKSGKNSVIPNHFVKLQDIKKEIVDENEEFLSFRSGLEIECDLCRETFQAEDDLMRHVDHIHQASSMYDRIKYKRSKEKEESEGHPKGKGKGKGKKSIESKPVRKEIFPEPETVIERPLTPTVVDSSNSNSLDDAAN